jgi:hypothetical protein
VPCRFDNDDPRRCDRCGAALWVAEYGLFCGECGVTMPCSMQLRPFPPEVAPAPFTTTPETSNRNRRALFDQAGL